jgi:2,5-diketo-D-gluconate reductase B
LINFLNAINQIVFIISKAMIKFTLPPIGLGTWNLHDEFCTQIVLEALDYGYRFIDTAQMYGNEQDVGNALEFTSIPREEIILATKIEPSNLSAELIHSSFEQSLERLKVDYLDILYVHWPNGKYNPEETLHAMDELVDEDTVRSIGISNFPIALVKEATAISDNILVNQMEMHPALRLKKNFDYNSSKGLYTVAYCPLGRGKLWDEPVLKSIAEKHNISVAQVCLTYLIGRGAVPIPKAGSIEHLQENFNALNYSLDKEDIDAIDTIPEKRIVDFGNYKWDVDD